MVDPSLFQCVRDLAEKRRVILETVRELVEGYLLAEQPQRDVSCHLIDVEIGLLVEVVRDAAVGAERNHLVRLENGPLDGLVVGARAHGAVGVDRRELDDLPALVEVGHQGPAGLLLDRGAVVLGGNESAGAVRVLGREHVRVAPENGVLDHDDHALHEVVAGDELVHAEDGREGVGDVIRGDLDLSDLNPADTNVDVVAGQIDDSGVGHDACPFKTEVLHEGWSLGKCETGSISGLMRMLPVC